MKRSVRYGSRSQVQSNNEVRQNTPTGDGHRLGDGYANRGARQRVIQEVRNQLQTKYNREAEEAAEKMRLKEQRKHEAWLARQEALVRPGYRLGCVNQVQQNTNPLRDLVNHNDYDGAENDAGSISEPQWVQQHLHSLVQNRIERERDAIQMQRRLVESRQIEYVPENHVRPGLGVLPRDGHVTSVSNNTNIQGPANQTSEFFLGTGYGASSSSNNAHANQTSTVNRGHVLGSSNNSITPSAPNAQGTSSASPGYVLGTGSAASPSASDGDVRDKEVDQREQMRAARLRLQEQYHAQVQEVARNNEQAEKIAEELKETSLN